MDDDRELVAASEAIVDEDAWPLALLTERVAVRTAFKRGEAKQPSLVAVERENVIFWHGWPFHASQ